MNVLAVDYTPAQVPTDEQSNGCTLANIKSNICTYIHTFDI